MERQRDSDQEMKQTNPKVIHSGFTYFPVARQILTLVIFAVLEAEGIYLCAPFNSNTNVSFFIGQVILLAITVYSWLHILDTVPGPMSELFKEDILKKAIQDGFNLNLNQSTQQGSQIICTSCQIQNATKTYHCDYCNRSVYKSYFHSQWLNTCVSKENFPSFISFLIFLFGYLILLGVQNLVVFYKIWDKDTVNFATFFIAHGKNTVVSIFLVGVALLVFIVGIMIVMTYYFAFRTRQSIVSVGCIADCQALNGTSTSNDRILHKIRQTIRQSSFIRLKSLSAAKNHHNLFKETQASHPHPFDLILKIFQQSSQHKIENEAQNNGLNQNQDTQNRLFSNLFAGILNLNKDKKEPQLPKEREKQIKKQNFAKQKWKNYRKSSFEKGFNVKRAFSMGMAFQDRNLKSRKERFGEINKGLNVRDEFIMKMNQPPRRKLQQQTMQQNQNVTIFPLQTMFNLTKKVSTHFADKLDEINEKQSNLQNESHSRKSLQQKKQNEQESMVRFIK